MATEPLWTRHDGVEAHHLTALEAAGGAIAFFTGRTGGVSDRWGAGLNWSYSVGDNPAQVRENRRRTLQALGLPLHRAVMAGLVHGDRVVQVTEAEEPGEEEVRVVSDCDALITDLPDLALIVTAADCVPVFFYDPVRRAVGVAHAGWRGTVSGIAGRTAEALVEHFGSRRADIRAAVGPSIGPCCYEVDDLVARPVREYFGPEAEAFLTPGRAPGKYKLDLWSANRLDLERAGVTRVSVSEVCTSCGVDRLFSHRAESGTAGRGAAVIALVDK